MFNQKHIRTKSTALLLSIAMLLSMVPTALVGILAPETAEAAFTRWAPEFDTPLGSTLQSPISLYYNYDTISSNSVDLSAAGGLDDDSHSDEDMLKSPFVFAWFEENDARVDKATGQLTSSYLSAFYAGDTADWFLQSTCYLPNLTVSDAMLDTYINDPVTNPGGVNTEFLESKKLKPGTKYYAYVYRIGNSTYANSKPVVGTGEPGTFRALADAYESPYAEFGYFITDLADGSRPTPEPTDSPTPVPTATPHMVQDIDVYVFDVNEQNLGSNRATAMAGGGRPTLGELGGTLSDTDNAFWFFFSTDPDANPDVGSEHAEVGTPAVLDKWNRANVPGLGGYCDIYNLQANTKYYLWVYRESGHGYFASDVSARDSFTTKPAGSTDDISNPDNPNHKRQEIEMVSQTNDGVSMTLTIREKSGYTSGTKKFVYGYSVVGETNIIWSPVTTATSYTWTIPTTLPSAGSYYMHAYEQGSPTGGALPTGWNDSPVIHSNAEVLSGIAVTPTPPPAIGDQSKPYFNGLSPDTLTSTSARLWAAGGDPGSTPSLTDNAYWFFVSTNANANPTYSSLHSDTSTPAELDKWNRANVVDLGYHLDIFGLTQNTKYYVWIYRESNSLWNRSPISDVDWFSTKPINGTDGWDPTRNVQKIQFKTVNTGADSISAEIQEAAGYTNGTKMYVYAISTNDSYSQLQWSAPTSSTMFNSGTLSPGHYYVYAYEQGRAPQGGDRGFNDSPIIKSIELTIKDNQSKPTVAIAPLSVTSNSATATASGGALGASSVFYFYISSSSDTPSSTATHNESSIPLLNQWNKSTNTINFTGLSAGRKYYVWVYRLGNENYSNSPISDAKWFNTALSGVDSWDPFKEIQLIKIDSVTSTATTATINISKVAGYEGDGDFVYGYSYNTSGTGDLHWTTPTDSTSHTFTLPEGEYYLYAYQVATNDFNRSPNVVSGQVITGQTTEQSTPAVQISAITKTSATATASGGADAAPNVFWFYISETNSKPSNSATHNYETDVVFDEWNKGTNTIDFTGLTAGTTYYVWTYREGDGTYFSSPVSDVKSFATTSESTGGGGSGGSGTAFTLQTIKDMAAKNQYIEIRYNNGEAFYRIPAKSFLVQETADELDTNCVLSQSPVTITITKATTDDTNAVSYAANSQGLLLKSGAYQFKMEATYKAKKTEVKEFNTFVSHYIKISSGSEPITTGVALNDDGSLRHVPTSFVTENGQRYAKINSLTTGVFALIYHSKITSDMVGHWAESYVKSGLSRTYIKGRDENWFDPTISMTRAEFTTAVTAALGLKPINGNGSFTDVKEGDWYNAYINAAKYYNVITGYGATFEPNAPIKREEAMTILTRVCALIGYDTNVSSTEAWNVIASFTDADKVSDWAKPSVAYTVKNRIVIGEWNMLKPLDYITRAEVITVLERMLRNTTLISD